MSELKAPPSFVTDMDAWEYTLARLALRDKLDEGGNPRNYAAAAAIYRNVKKKYPDGADDLKLIYDEAEKAKEEG